MSVELTCLWTREWNHAEIYRKAMVLFAERLRER